MSSTYSSSLRIQLLGAGDQSGTWGDTTNGNFSFVLDKAIAGYQTVSVISANQALTYVDGPTATAGNNQSVYAMLRFTTTTTAAFNVYAPPTSKQYIVWNNSGYTMNLIVSDPIGSTSPITGNVALAIPNGIQTLVWTNGISFYAAHALTATAATTATNATNLATTNFTIQESGGKLVFKYGATTIASMDSSGNIISVADMTAYGTP
jgi:hypothetical protein